MNEDEYREYVEMIARNVLEVSDDPTWTLVATQSIIGTEFISSSDGYTLLLGLEPYADNPADQTRLWPKDVITNSEQGPPRDGGHVRGFAVNALAADLEEVAADI